MLSTGAKIFLCPEGLERSTGAPSSSSIRAITEPVAKLGRFSMVIDRLH